MKIPFDRDRCIAGDEVITRSGDDYVFGAYNEKMAWPIIGWIGGFSISHMVDGRRCKDNRNSAEDLFMKQKKITRWTVASSKTGFKTKELAMEYVNNCKWNGAYGMDDTAIIKMEFYPGENLD